MKSIVRVLRWSVLLVVVLLPETGDGDAGDGKLMELHTPHTVDGRPPLGTYAVSKIEDVALVKKAGMNLVIGGHEMLDIDSPVGKYLSENGIKVLYHLTHHIYGMPRLGDLVAADQTTIPLSKRRARTLPSPGVVQIEEELIRYEEYTPAALLRCQRGFGGTQPAAHHEGIILFMPDECAEDVKSVKDSPNLWGYYVLDDSPGDAISALRAMYKIVRRVDGGPERHVVCAGYGSAGSLCNFGPGVCDVMLIYWYPISGSGYHRYMISHEVQWMLTAARARVPGIPFIGVYQAFWGEGAGATPPTAHHVREQFEDFVREGASGLVAFAGRIGGSLTGWTESVPLQKAIKECHEEILSTGGLRIPPQPERMLRERIQPVGFWEKPNEVPGVPPVWHVIGPFHDTEKAFLETVYPPEREVDLEAVYEGKSGPVRWVERASHAGVIGLGELYGEQDYTANTVAYATCTPVSLREHEAMMTVGSDDDIVVWFDDKKVWRHEGTRGLTRDEDSVPVVLGTGSTRILVKVYNRQGMWGFSLRLTDRKGLPLGRVQFFPSTE